MIMKQQEKEIEGEKAPGYSNLYNQCGCFPGSSLLLVWQGKEQDCSLLPCDIDFPHISKRSPAFSEFACAL